MKEKDSKMLLKKIICIIIIIILTVILIFLYKKLYNKLLQKKNFENSILDFAEKNQETIFSIDKIIYFSSSDSKNKSSSISNFTIENLYTYTDIALFINNGQDENSKKNTLKNVKINNMKFTKEPSIGTPSLYYKSINNFAKSEIEESNIIKDELEFKITSEDNIELNSPILYNNCANPITISYVNQNIKNDYTITDTSNPITYNGKILKRCGVLISSIDTTISFDIEIENNNNQKFKTTVYFNVPYEEEGKSIYDGSITVRQNTNIKFYRYE